MSGMLKTKKDCCICPSSRPTRVLILCTCPAQPPSRPAPSTAVSTAIYLLDFIYCVKDCRRVSVHQVLETEEQQRRMAERNIYSSARIFNARVGHLIGKVMMSRSSGMGVRVHHTIKEFGDVSGWPHCHGVAWRREGEAKEAFEKAQNGEVLSTQEEKYLCNLASSTLSVRLSATKLQARFPDLDIHRASKVAALAKQHQLHECTTKCTWDDGDGDCSFFFPRLPSEYPIITKVATTPARKEIDQYFLDQCQKIKVAVSEAIKELHAAGQLMSTTLRRLLLQALGDIDNAPNNHGCYRWKGGIFPPRTEHKEFGEWQDKIGSSDHPHRERHRMLFAIYYTALSTSTRRRPKEIGPYIHELVMIRDVSEAYVSTYNPYLLEAMRSNMDVSLILHTPYDVLDYISKGGGDRYQRQKNHSVKKVKALVGPRAAGRVDQMKEVTESEAYYRLDPELSLSDTNLTVEWVNAVHPSRRTASYVRDDGPEGVSLPGLPGLFVQTSGLLHKFQTK